MGELTYCVGMANITTCRSAKGEYVLIMYLKLILDDWCNLIHFPRLTCGYDSRNKKNFMYVVN